MHMRRVTVPRMRERYAQTVLTFRITYVNYIARETKRVKVLLVSCVETQMAVVLVVTNTIQLPPSTGHRQHFPLHTLLGSSDGPSIRQ